MLPSTLTRMPKAAENSALARLAEHLEADLLLDGELRLRRAAAHGSLWLELRREAAPSALLRARDTPPHAREEFSRTEKAAGHEHGARLAWSGADLGFVKYEEQRGRTTISGRPKAVPQSAQQKRTVTHTTAQSLRRVAEVERPRRTHMDYWQVLEAQQRTYSIPAKRQRSDGRLDDS